MSDLKLAAFDGEDLQVLSAHLQDAVLLIRDLAYQKVERRFVLIVNRFDWTKALSEQARSGAARKGRDTYERRRAALRIEHVEAVQLQGVELSAKGATLNLLAIQFEETEAPSGYITLVFAGGGAIRLTVEAIECEMKDLGAAWGSKSMPQHDDDDDVDADSFDAHTDADADGE